MRHSIDPYVYVKCKMCSTSFRVVKSGAGILWLDDFPNKRVALVDCPRCGEGVAEVITKREWIKSNEVRPDATY